MWSDKQLADEIKMRKYIAKSEDNNKAFKKMRDVVSAWRYHQDTTTKQILKTQSDRVGAHFDRIENGIADQEKEYVKVGLKESWNSFMKGRAEKAR